MCLCTCLRAKRFEQKKAIKKIRHCKQAGKVSSHATHKLDLETACACIFILCSRWKFAYS
jgi:hypothetical protein